MITRARLVMTLVASAAAVAAVGAVTVSQLPHLSTANATTSASSATSTRTAVDNGLTMSATSAKSTLKVMKVVKPISMSGYTRDKFPSWRDASTWGWPVAPSNSCDARQAALFRDGKGVKVNSNCTATSGYWIDPYTLTKITISRSVDIDHMVPLANAWRSGAAKWTTTQRTKYANSPTVLLSTGASANRSKGDKGPEAWKPSNKKVHCSYARRWVQVKSSYKLTLTSESERTALKSMLATC